MNKTINQLRLFLCTFSGEDDFIIRRCPKEIQLSFAAIGFFVILIFIGCFISATTFTYSIFDQNALISAPFGIFWALMISLIYLLLLYTITPPILPNRNKKAQSLSNDLNSSNENNIFSITMLLRVVFMLLMAIIIAQPLSVYFFSKNTDKSIERFKQEQRARMIIVSDSLFINSEIALKKDFDSKLNFKISNRSKEEIFIDKSFIDLKVIEDEKVIDYSISILDSINKLDNILFLSKDQKSIRDNLVEKLSKMIEFEIRSDLNFKNKIDSINCSDVSIKEDFDKYKSDLKSIINSKINNYDKLDILLNNSNFYIQKISILFKEIPSSWIVTLLVCIIFLLPIYLKFIIRNKTGYYELRKKYEKNIVEDAYEDFKIQYSKILSTKIKDYNFKYKSKLDQFLLKLKSIDKESYKKFSLQFEKEFQEENIEYFENWIDCPFKTIKSPIINIKNNEKEFLDFIYSIEEE
jgi:Domain of unknown function (DUF4407)